MSTLVTSVIAWVVAPVNLGQAFSFKELFGKTANMEKTTTASPTTYKIYYYLQDHLGNVTDVVDEHGNILEVKDYLPFGGTNVDETYSDYKSDYAYNDKEKDPEADLYYYGARYYNDATSKFTSIDPALLSQKYLTSILNDPQKLNSYSYARNNPINYVDDNGEEPNKAQATTIDVIVDKVKTVEDSLGDDAYNYEYVLASIYQAFQEADDKYNPRYVYTEKEGWIDFKHFFGGAFHDYDSDYFTTAFMGYALEIEQLFKKDESAFSYEDLPSDFAGEKFAEVLKYIEDNNLGDIKLSDVLKSYFEDINAMNPEDAPNYDELDEDAFSGDGKDGSNGGSNNESESEKNKEQNHD
ncbi:RHS repeat-associated core domain-containing protein [Candidatus Peregrinibacteria bacterium]|nr:RHS repeat-associated core domain-containing protein [Candidatus Peregrinibacteria bacterium]